MVVLFALISYRIVTRFLSLVLSSYCGVIVFLSLSDCLVEGVLGRNFLFICTSWQVFVVMKSVISTISFAFLN